MAAGPFAKILRYEVEPSKIRSECTRQGFFLLRSEYSVRSTEYWIRRFDHPLGCLGHFGIWQLQVPGPRDPHR